ncbi:hypothetical protein J1605_019704 [Eschrichtius robustus]|uniref:Uncharacterized protein n=1 Tax=Eschrichtius robustus TaxID=9764 RepID=A0AB34HNN0_ESCRO|nr:hypothetical protein J1605_019704 [Eschrichtius robustus]
MHQLRTSPILVQSSPDQGKEAVNKRSRIIMNLKNQRLCCFSWGANFAGSPAQTASDLALRPIWMHRTPAGDRDGCNLRRLGTKGEAAEAGVSSWRLSVAAPRSGAEAGGPGNRFRGRDYSLRLVLLI